MAVGPGDPAPDFRLPATGGRDYSLGDFRGRPLVLAFYPADHTPVCTLQLRSYSQDFGMFEELGAAVLGVSPQSVESHEDFARENELLMPLLADEDKEMAKAYDVLGPVGFYRRSVFVIDADGVVRWAHRAPGGTTYRSVDEIASVLAGL